MDSESGWRRPFLPLRNPRYRMYWLGMLAYFMAMNMGGIARSWLAYDLSGKATALGLVSLAWGTPMVLFSLFGGAIADRSDKRRLTLASQAAMFCVALAAAVLVQTGLIQIWQLAVLAFIEGTIFSIAIPARMAWVPELVEERDLMSSIALNNGGMQATRVVGPALAGGLIALPFFGVTGAFYVVAACYVVVFLCLSRIPSTGVSDKERDVSLTERMASGLRYIAGHDLMRLLLLLAFLLVMLGAPFQVMLPVFAGEEVFDVGSVGLGIMAMAAGIGATLGAFTVGSLADRIGQARAQLLAGIGFGLALCLFGLARNFYMALPVLALLGLTSTAYMVINNTLVFAHSSRQFHGRVMSVYMLTWSIMPIAAMPITAIADVAGAQRVVFVLGVMLIGALLLTKALSSSYRRMDEMTSALIRQREGVATEPEPAADS